jgi:hypothetical protein
MTCLDCPYSELKERHEYDNFQDDHAYCEKVGGKHYACGWCSECEQSANERKQNRAIKKQTDKRYRREKYNNKLKRLYDNCKWYPNPVTKQCYENFNEIELPYYKRLYKGNHKTSPYRFYKKHSNRLVRKNQDVPNYSGYKKVFDYWWTVD